MTANSWYSYQPLPVIENGRIKILWDFGITTMSHVVNNRPDIVVFMRETPHKNLLIEVSCPADINVLDKEAEKMTKY